MLTPTEYAKVSYGLTNTMEYLCIHGTGNTSAGAGALSHAKLQKNGNSRQASWQYTVDDTKAYQSLPNKVAAWHAGSGNQKSIAIEICVNKDGNWNKTMKNAVQLAAKLLKEHKIPLNKMVQHNYFTGKDCPREIRAGKGGWTWSKFVAAVKSEMDVKKKTNTEKAIGTIKIVVDELNYYDTPRWIKASGKVKKNEVYTVMQRLTVAGSQMYRLKSGNYISASSKYVEYKNKY